LREFPQRRLPRQAKLPLFLDLGVFEAGDGAEEFLLRLAELLAGGGGFEGFLGKGMGGVRVGSAAGLETDADYFAGAYALASVV
jgi:hypothetical protein